MPDDVIFIARSVSVNFIFIWLFYNFCVSLRRVKYFNLRVWSEVKNIVSQEKGRNDNNLNRERKRERKR